MSYPDFVLPIKDERLYYFEKIQELESKLEIAREALVYHMEQTRPIQKTIEALERIK